VQDDGGHDVDEEGDYFVAAIRKMDGKKGRGGEWEGGRYKEWKTREFRQAMMAHATDPYAKQ